MEPMRVLVVEDNPVVADAVAEGLRDQGMAVDVAYDGPTGLEKAAVNTYDVVVLDRDLPRLHGDVLCQQIVDSPGSSRILMLTAAALVQDRVEGLNLGADDYLVKPFDFSELVARVRALAPRRSAPGRGEGGDWGARRFSAKPFRFPQTGTRGPCPGPPQPVGAAGAHA